ncbi:urea ABC transporter substrate-binding protein [Muricoccus pecuniae]|uniref:Urea transport system substrate-binding protein n=1 Tax=Muricoccus pecuniae TaxID=693023 RepID=A0A840Y750_9PROT|nr:urea transport system substrate-binding protein [Roseomonas pecuniae]
MSLNLTRRAALAGLGGALAMPAIRPSFAQGSPIKVGVLHSLSGTMAISETALRDTVLMMIEWANSKGGVLGRRLEPVVVDPASNWPLFAEKARELLAVSKVDVTFGCWTSVSRKSVLPVFEELNGLLFYPVQYEGEEQSRNVFYTGAAPNQQAIPAVEYLMGKDGGEAKRIALLGTDYVYPRTTNRILRAYLNSKGISDADIMEEYTPFGHSDWQGIVSRVKRFAGEGKRTAIVSTINGDANVPFYRELGNQGIKAEDIPCVAFSVGEEELAGIDTKPLVGHLAAWNYFMSVPGAPNDEFKAMWRAYIKNDKRVTNDPMEATYTGFRMWTQAVQKAGTTAVDAVRQAMYGQKVMAPCGYEEEMRPNHHLTKPVMIGEVQENGQFNIVHKTPTAIAAENWSPFIPENASRRG